MTDSERLRQERRSYILGSLLVLVITVIALSALSVILLHGVWPKTYAELKQRVTALQGTLTWEQYFSEQLVYWAGGAGLFFLNFRFSLLLRRPAAAFSPIWTGARVLWWVVLFMNSVFYTFIFPQLIITWILAHWGSSTIAHLEARAAAEHNDGGGQS